MASQEDQGAKTEKPTPFHKEKSIQSGNIPLSRELYGAILLSCLMLWILYPGGQSIKAWAQESKKLWCSFGTKSSSAGFVWLRHQCFQWIGSFGLLWIAVWFTGLVQTRGRLFPKRFQRQEGFWLKGFSSFLSRDSWKRAGSSVLKMMVFFGLLGFFFLKYHTQFPVWCTTDLTHGADSIWAAWRFLMITILAFLWVFALSEWGLAFWKWRQSIAMSRSQIQEEYKTQEGNPAFKGYRKRKHQEILEATQSIQNLPKANVVIVNPTHYTVAIQWKTNMPAPLVIAKGTDGLAQKLRSQALAQGIPIMTQPALARAIHKEVPLGKPIHSKHYQGVAALIRFLMERNPELFR